MPEIRETAKLTITPETQQKWTSLVAAAASAMRTLAEAYKPAADALTAFAKTFEQTSSSTAGRKRYPGVDQGFARLGHRR